MLNKKLIATVHNRQIIRTPYFPLSASLQDNIEDLKLLIKEASPEFYQTIIDVKGNDYNRNYDKLFFTLWKYFNRAKYRATPFAKFASVAISPVSDFKANEIVQLQAEPSEHKFRDWDEKDRLLANPEFLVSKANKYITNSTLYSVGNNYRFVTTINGIFEIITVDCFDEMLFLVDYCRTPRSKADILYQLEYKFSLSKKAINMLLRKLIKYQLLFTDRLPNIIGDDYFKRININSGDVNAMCYTITRRKRIAGEGDKSILNNVPELINFLNQNLPYPNNLDLDKFKKAFINKFEKQSIPLSIALDPELGVGYADLELNATDYEKNEIESLFNLASPTKNDDLTLNPFLAFIFSKLSHGSIINIEEFDAKSNNIPILLPNSLSILYHKWKEHLVINDIGGCTANALLGRFTLCHHEFESLGREVVDYEQRANPDVAFFDVGYSFEKHIDNVNRRKKIYANELPLFSWSDNENPLNLEDIYVSIIDNEIVLHSKKLRKRIVPRIPTAYNYKRSDLGIFRFLNDLQHYLLRTDLSFPVQFYIPGQIHYPRIMFKNIILSPQMWLIDKRTLQRIIDLDIHEGILLIYDWLEATKIVGSFAVGKGDQYLIFSPINKDDMAAFYLYCCQNRQQQFYLSEAFIDKDTGVVNEKGEEYRGQFSAVILINQEIYSSKMENVKFFEPFNSEIERKISPGGKWVYFELYCHPSRANCLLLKNIKELINKVNPFIERWFFIRYNLLGHHIRLRIELKDQDFFSEVVKNCYKCLETEFQSGIVSDIQIKSYVREIERYGNIGIMNIENLFYLDSKYVFNVMGNSDMSGLYYLALKNFEMLISQTFSEPEQQINFIKTMAATFSKEFAFDSTSYKSINRNYKQLKERIKNGEYLSTTFGILFLKKFKKIIQLSSEKKDQVLSDILHMHINRLFNDNNRRHEAIIYQYLLKERTMRIQMDLKLQKELQVIL